MAIGYNWKNVQLKLTWGIGELIMDIELFIVIEVNLGKLQKNECINKPRPPRIEWESQGMFFTAFAINLQSIFFLDDMIPFPTHELLPMARAAPSCHRWWLLSPQKIWLISLHFLE